jgi:transmembrane sensor
VTEQVPTAAAIWLARIERGLQPHEGTALCEWLQHSEHRETIVNTAKLYHGPDVIAVLAALVPVGFGNPLPPRPRQSRAVAVMVGVCLLIFTGFLPFIAIRVFPGFFYPHTKPIPGISPRNERIYSTDARQTRTIRLPEGSQAILNGQSQIYVLYAAWVREATVAHGEVMFDVTAIWPRPILIFAGGRHFEAPGGRFDLRLTSPVAVRLTVLQGTVTVKGLPFQRPTTPEQAREFDPSVFADAMVGPMQTAIVDQSGLTRHAITAADLRSQLGWEPQQVMYISQ